jgi:hypothetical protein
VMLIVDASAGETEKAPRIGPFPRTDATSSDASSFLIAPAPILLANSHVSMTPSERQQTLQSNASSEKQGGPVGSKGSLGQGWCARAFRNGEMAVVRWCV